MCKVPLRYYKDTTFSGQKQIVLKFSTYHSIHSVPPINNIDLANSTFPVFKRKHDATLFFQANQSLPWICNP